MTPPTDPERYKNHRFPGEIISHGVWLYYRNHRKTPSFSYGDIRWCLRSRQSISSEVRGVTMKPLALAMGRSHAPAFTIFPSQENENGHRVLHHHQLQSQLDVCAP